MAKSSKLTRVGQWCKHLREWKKHFWGRERGNVKREIKKDIDNN